jgi:hypothetical protein
MADERTMGEKLQSLPGWVLYLALFIVCSVPLFFTIPVPNNPEPSSIAFYNFVRNIPKGSTLLIASDWTNSTRGESAGEFKALLRVLMRNDVKLAIYSTADPQAPQVAKDVIVLLNEERKLAGQRTYEQWKDYVKIGYFPNAEAAAVSIQNNVRNAFADKKDFDDTGQLRSVLESPVLAGINKVSDFPGLVVVTASNTSVVTIQRVTATKLTMMVTGVMGPETNNYFASGQLKGLVIGLKGVYDMETLMNRDYAGMKNLDNGAAYYPTLHLALLLLIVVVVTGNVGMLMSRKRSV